MASTNIVIKWSASSISLDNSLWILLKAQSRNMLILLRQRMEFPHSNSKLFKLLHCVTFYLYYESVSILESSNRLAERIVFRK
jgi:phage-related holin